MTKARALVVDDEQDILELLRITLARMGIDCRAAADLSTARRLLTAESFDLCLTDMRLPDGNGIELVREIASQYPQLPVAMITAHGNMDSAVEAMKAGAFDFVSKPVDLQVLRRLVEAALRLRTTGPTGTDRAAGMVSGSGADQGGEDHPVLLGASPAMVELRRLIAKLARNQAPVYVSGESGTGKELAARLIHGQGPRSTAPFVPVNCGAIPPDLVESELFGHKKGAFTGAIQDNPGLFQAADGGTLFLDEVAELPLPAQVKLLRVLQEKKARPVGSQREVPVDVRLISATHRDLAAEVASGRFRQDLFYRINVIELRLPPLRERADDIPLLAEHFLRRIARQNGMRVPTLSAQALATLAQYPFPGNVRELENILERALALAEGPSLEAADLYLPGLPATAPLRALRGTPAPFLDTKAGVARDLAVPSPARAAAAGETEETGTEAAQESSLADSIGEIQRQVILRTLEETRWNRTAAAKQLGMSLRSLRYRLSKLGIE